MLKVGIIGLGRMGRIHLQNLKEKVDGVELVAAMNPSQDGQQFAHKYAVPHVSDDVDSILKNKEIDAVIISSPSDSHSEYAIRASKAGKAVFCEKPIDRSLEEARSTVQQISKLATPLMIGFNQRFDPNFAKVKDEITKGSIGELCNLHIISRDPQPPPISYIETSGGLFMDMTIHDFDMARFIMGCEVEEVYASGACLIDPAIGEAGDIDSATVILKFENGATATIENSRQCSYGYDQRMEVFSSKGMLKVDNPLKSVVSTSTESGTSLDRNLDFFMDRYRSSYLEEMQAFVKALNHNQPMPVTGEDGLAAMQIAQAANQSLKNNTPVRVQDID